MNKAIGSKSILQNEVNIHVVDSLEQAMSI